MPRCLDVEGSQVLILNANKILRRRWRTVGGIGIVWPEIREAIIEGQPGV